jgi:putative oxidoreductase
MKGLVMNANADLGLLLLRLGVGGIMLAVHGWGQKLSRFSDVAYYFPDPLHVGQKVSLGLTVFAEVGCSFLIVIGLATRLATLPLMFTMGMVVLVVKSGSPFSDNEIAILFFIAFLTLFFTGAGRYSLDAQVARRWYRTFPALGE